MLFAGLGNISASRKSISRSGSGGTHPWKPFLKTNPASRCPDACGPPCCSPGSHREPSRGSSFACSRTRCAAAAASTSPMSNTQAPPLDPVAGTDGEDGGRPNLGRGGAPAPLLLRFPPARQGTTSCWLPAIPARLALRTHDLLARAALDARSCIGSHAPSTSFHRPSRRFSSVPRTHTRRRAASRPAAPLARCAAAPHVRAPQIRTTAPPPLRRSHSCRVCASTA
jgi:hypothetical protein